MTLYDQFKEELKNYIQCEDIIQFSKFNKDPTYIKIITILLYDLYVELETIGETEYIIPEFMIQTINELKGTT